MNLSPLGLTAAKVPAAVPARRADVGASELLAACRAAADQGARLVALWATDDRDLDRVHDRVAQQAGDEQRNGDGKGEPERCLREQRQHRAQFSEGS